MAILLLGFFVWHLIQSPQPLPNSIFSRPITVLGIVDGIPQRTPLGSRFLLRIKTLNGKKYVGKIEVAWYQHDKVVHPDEQWRWLLKLKPVHGLHNPGGFNVERWATMRGIVASGYVLQSNKTELISRHQFSIDRFRENIQYTIAHRLHSLVLASIINALSIGSKNLLSPETWRVFQRTGTSHLIAISGLHVGLVVGITYFCINYLLRCFPWLLLQYPAQRWAAIGSVIVAWGYGFLVGFSLPTQRAVIMMTILMLSSLFSRQCSIWQRLLLAFLMILALQPLAIFSASFWLSFIAVFWIAYATFIQQRWLCVKLVLSLGLLPVTLYCFKQISSIALIANLIAIPWVTMLIVPLCLLASVSFMFSTVLASWIWCLAAQCFYPLWCLLQYLSHIRLWLHPINDVVVMLSALLGVLLLASPRGLPLRQLGISLLLPLFFYFPPYPKNNTVRLTVLDVGQGLSAVIQTAHHVLVYDTGPRFPTGFDAGRSVIVPFLKTAGIRKINTLVISHGDNDHIGGSFWLVKHLPIDQILSSITTSRWHHRFHSCFSGQSWEWDGVAFHMLWPPKNAKYVDNNSSCVLRISLGKRAILLTGDIGKSVEHALLTRPEVLQSDILIAPHHGSRRSSTLAFVETVHPVVVIMPVGYLNRYHFPAESVLKRYSSEGAQIFSTVKYGAVSITLGIGSRIGDNRQLIYKVRSFYESAD